MTASKAWDWGKENAEAWRQPCEESYYLAELWKQRGVKQVLDFGCGLGRHAVYFAKQGFDVSAFDLSEEATEHLREWATSEAVSVDIQVADMINLPYPDNSFDALFSYHVISHTDTNGIRIIIDEMKRVLRPNADIFLTLCSKETWSYKDSGFPRVDDNTVINDADGPEKGIPHFYVMLDDIKELLCDFELEKVRHSDDYYFAEGRKNSKHYFIYAHLKI